MEVGDILPMGVGVETPILSQLALLHSTEMTERKVILETSTLRYFVHNQQCYLKHIGLLLGQVTD